MYPLTSKTIHQKTGIILFRNKKNHGFNSTVFLEKNVCYSFLSSLLSSRFAYNREIQINSPNSTINRVILNPFSPLIISFNSIPKRYGKILLKLESKIALKITVIINAIVKIKMLFKKNGFFKRKNGDHNNFCTLIL